MEATRNWICVRPATYESEDEADVLLELLAPRDGVLRNTVFCLLGSDAKPLSRAGRSPQQVFGSVGNVIVNMQSIEARHRTKDARLALPEVPDLRLGLNIAACDDVPLVVGLAKDERQAKELRERLAEQAWSEELLGRAHYLVLVGRNAGKAVQTMPGVSKRTDVVVLRPDAYGLAPEVVTATRASNEDLGQALVAACDSPSRAASDTRAHVREARGKGIEWESVIPPTDGPQATDDGQGRRRRR